MVGPMPDTPVALVVGDGSGVGADAARKLAADGYHIGVMSASGTGEALGFELGGFGFTGSNLIVNDLQQFVGKAMQRWDRVDAVVESAAHGPRGDVLGIGDEDWHRSLDASLLNVVRMARVVTPIMQEQGGGSIVNVSTFAAFEPDPDLPTTAVFRAALTEFTKRFATQYVAANVRMNNVLPTEPHRVARTTAGRSARAEELCDVIAFLASDRSSSITGQDIRVDVGPGAPVRSAPV